MTELHVTRIFDLREYDYLRMEYFPLEPGCGNWCDRCGKEHARVYVLSDGSMVGVKCCGKKLEGEAKELEREWKKVQNDKAKEAMKVFLDTVLSEMIKEARVLNETQGYITHEWMYTTALQKMSPLPEEKRFYRANRLISLFSAKCGPMRVKGDPMFSFESLLEERNTKKCS